MNTDRRGRRRTPDTLRTQLIRIDEQLADGVRATDRLQLLQRRLDLTTALETATAPVEDVHELEVAFIAVAKSYAARKGIAYAAWRQVGVAAPVLRQAGITR